MKISVLGAGYVGLTTAAILAERGHEVVCADIDSRRVALIQKGISPIDEEGLVCVLEACAGKTLRATRDVGRAIHDSQLTFVCVQTPSARNGDFDLSALERACRQMGGVMRGKESHIAVVRSTVPPLTTERTVLPLLERTSKKKCGEGFGLAYFPEFLREGHALHDARNPSRLVIGACDKKSEQALLALSDHLSCKKIICSPATAEMVKLASNAMLATRVSFINEIGRICSRIGVDVYDVARGMAADPRIGASHLDAGLGFGGACLPKDLLGLVMFSRKVKERPLVMQSALKVNDGQVGRFSDMARVRKGERVGILGLAFKRGTDDVRESQALKVVDILLKKKALPYVYDPRAVPNVRKRYGAALHYCSSAREVLRLCEKILILTDWEEFADLDYQGKKVLDGRHAVRALGGFEYHGLGW